MRIAILIDGGYLRAVSRRKGQAYNASFIERFAKECALKEETIWRIFYYDCPPYTKKLKHPSSKKSVNFPSEGFSKKQRQLLSDIVKKELFALRRGVLHFRGWVRVTSPQSQEDFRPNFVQKGVDMRIGLDVATLSAKKVVDRIILVSGDTDMIPAMKHARIEGLQVGIVKFKDISPEMHQTLLEHADLIREVKI